MEEAVKKVSYVRPGVGRVVDEQRHGEADATPAPTPDKPPAGDRQHDRWFLEQRGGRRVAKRLNIVNDLQVTARGPFKLTGNITLVDSDGQESFHNELTLCRCGASQSKPLCDNQHVEIEFFDNGAVNQASQTARSNTPQPLVVTVIENGPLLFRGYLRVFNARGQECVSRKGALCRCGKSSKKPFCDCYRP